MIKIQRALISVFDKDKLDSLVRVLYREKVEILSTGGTKDYIKALGIPCTDVSEYTGFPEILDGRVKTLNPKIFGGILYRRDLPAHARTIEKHEIKPIDLVVVNLYPFEKVINTKHDYETAIENIDIGGVSLLRAAAKNAEGVVVLSDPEQYKIFVREFNQNDAKVSNEMAKYFASKVFELTHNYDALISSYLQAGSSSTKNEEQVKEEKLEIPGALLMYSAKAQDLRYGENPHQKAAIYKDPNKNIRRPEQLHGKELSYNNVLDIDAAIKIAYEFKDSICIAIIKHTNPCGVAVSKTALADAYLKARDADPISFFGGIVTSTKEVDEMTAKLINESFLEVIVAPSFSEPAFEILKKKQNLRLVTYPIGEYRQGLSIKETVFGTLVQEEDLFQIDERLENKTSDINDELIDKETLMFAMKVCKHVKSNAIVLAKNMATVGVGAGQMSRIDSLKIALEKSKGKAQDSVMASDAFFPFSDCVDLAAASKISAIVQPGGSLRDNDSIEAAIKHRLPLYFTGVRHFRH